MAAVTRAFRAGPRWTNSHTVAASRLVWTAVILNSSETSGPLSNGRVLKMCGLEVYIKSFGGQKGGSLEPPRTPPLPTGLTCQIQFHGALRARNAHLQFMTSPHGVGLPGSGVRLHKATPLSVKKPHPFSSVIRTGSLESTLWHGQGSEDKNVLVCCICVLAGLLIRYSCACDSLIWFACTTLGSYYFAVCANVLIEATYRVSLSSADIVCKATLQCVLYTRRCKLTTRSTTTFMYFVCYEQHCRTKEKYQTPCGALSILQAST